VTIRVYNCALNRHHKTHTKPLGDLNPRGFVVPGDGAETR
jgi:hypothetical protein